MKKSLLLLLAAFATLAASAQTKVEIDGIWYNLVSKIKQAEVTKNPDGSTKYSGSITIPAMVTYEGGDYSVTSIGDDAFYYCTSLTDINIPESVTSIGNYAFHHCKNITSITIPENSQLTSIGDNAFHYCSGLTNINIPDGVTSIKGYTFDHCSSLATITIPKGVTSIGRYAFADCSSLTTITIPENVTSIEKRAFERCNSLMAVHISNISAWCNIYFDDNPLAYAGNLYLNGELVTELTIPEGVTSIGGDTFSHCSSLTAIILPESVTSIGSSAFYNCTSLTTITIPKNSQLTSIGNYAFKYCSRLTAITLPEGVTSIGSSAFYSCNNLTSVNIPESVTSIEYESFYECGIATITIPKSVTNIGWLAFANCTDLLDVYCYATSVPLTSLEAFDGALPEYAVLHVPTSALASYKSTAPWSSFGKFETFDVAVSEIVLNKSEVTLFEGEKLFLTATVTPDDAADKSISWSSSNPSVATVDNTGKVTAVAPGTATITATANDGSGVSALCEIIVKKKLLGKCATPTISYKDGEVIFACDTEGVTFISETTEDIAGNRNNAKFALIPTYTITVYATKENYEDSDEVTVTLCWIPCTEEHEDETTGILTIPSKPLLISTQGGTITVSGLAADTEVIVTNTAGTPLATATATDGTATLATNLTAGSIAIVKVGDYSIKVAIK